MSVASDVIGMFLAATTIISVVALPVSCVKNTDTQIAEMVKDGVDPLDARCAVATMNDRICLDRERNRGADKDE